MKPTDVLILLGSASDESYLEGCVSFLKQLEIPYAVRVASAHRSPERVVETLKAFEDNAKVILCFAGHAAHLAGVVAAHTIKPVIAVPLPTSDLQGMDSLLAAVQMPGGIPVATVAIGNAGSRNAACLAAQILAIGNRSLTERYQNYRDGLKSKVAEASLEVEKKWER